MRDPNPVAVRLPSPFRLFDSFFADSLPEMFPGPQAPATNIAETADQLILSFELPGVEEQDIELRAHEGRLSISTERKDERQNGPADTTWHRFEQRVGRWERTVILPESANTDAIEAVFKNGILRVAIQKHPKSKPVRVQIKAS